MFIAAIFTISRTWKQPRCTFTNEWIKKMWYTHTHTHTHTHSGILLSHKKEWIWVGFSKVHEPRASYTECSKSEKHISHINTHIWNLLGWCKSNFSFALLNFAIRYLNTFLYKSYVIHHFNAQCTILASCFLLMNYYLLFILYVF